MATNFWNGYDGTGRQPREIQLEALNWIKENLSAKVLAMNLPTGAGKSLIAKTIANKFGAHVITPANALIDQYSEIYPDHNALKGKRHYTCASGLSCQEWTNVLQQKPCPNCPYQVAKQRALEEPTFFNPLSYHYLRAVPQWVSPRTLVIDEAHQLGSMLLMLCGVRLPFSRYKFPKASLSETVLVPYLLDLANKLKKLVHVYKNDTTRQKEIMSILTQLELTAHGLREDAQNYAIYTEKGFYYRKPEVFLNIRPIQPPKFVTQSFLDSRQIILMSGTLFEPDIRDLIGDRHYKFLDLPSPIPVESRRVYYRPAPFPMNYQTDPRDIVRLIETILDYHPGENAIIHVTYGMSSKLKSHFRRPVLTNTSENKDEIIARFKEKGGIFLAAGCAEGIDLPGDLCRVNIIPKLPFPDLSDKTVQQRKTLVDGDDWYKLTTFKTLIQQCGRSTRNESDFSKTYILDSNFSRIFRSIKGKLPKYFVESIVWGTR